MSDRKEIANRRQAIMRALKREGAPPLIEKMDRPERHPYGTFFERSPAGIEEWRKREILARTYVKGDLLRVDYIFGTVPWNDDSPKQENTIVFLGWEDSFWGKGDENLTYQGKDAKPGIYRSYGRIRADLGGKELMINADAVTLQDQVLATARIEEWGEKSISTGFTRVGDLPSRT